MTRGRGERGAALVEAPIAIVVMLAIGFGAFWVGNVVTSQAQLEKAVHAGSRYGTRAETDLRRLGQPDAYARRRTLSEIEAFTRQATDWDDVAEVTLEVRCGDDVNALVACPSPESEAAGGYIEIEATATLPSTGAAGAMARTVNSLFGLVGADDVLPETITVSATSVALVE